MKNALIFALVMALGIVSYRLAHVENQRYALLVGMCQQDDANPRGLVDCLRTAQTRTSWAWHLYYGLTYL